VPGPSSGFSASTVTFFACRSSKTSSSDANAGRTVSKSFFASTPFSGDFAALNSPLIVSPRPLTLWMLSSSSCWRKNV
jgi:hypothetical protein